MAGAIQNLLKRAFNMDGQVEEITEDQLHYVFGERKGFFETLKTVNNVNEYFDLCSGEAILKEKEFCEVLMKLGFHKDVFTGGIFTVELIKTILYRYRLKPKIPLLDAYLKDFDLPSYCEIGDVIETLHRMIKEGMFCPAYIVGKRFAKDFSAEAFSNLIPTGNIQA